MTQGLQAGPDGLLRCPWSLDAPDYLRYHDEEWGKPVRTDTGVFERLCLEAFQSGLSWLIILRKRENFRRAFANFDAETMARFGPADIDRLLADQGIVRNRAKIEAVVANAQVALSFADGIAAQVWKYADSATPAPVSLADVPSSTSASKALAKDLRSHGFRFTGPVTVYATMQSCGVVNDHLVGCTSR